MNFQLIAQLIIMIRTRLDASRSSVQSFTILAAAQEIPAKQRCETVRSKTDVEQTKSTSRVATTKSKLDQQKQTQYLVSPDMGRFLTIYSTHVKTNLPSLHGRSLYL